MSYVAQDDLEKAVLYRLFEYAQRGDKSLEAEEVVKLLHNKFSLKRTNLALSSLEHREYISGYHGYGGSSYDISEAGYRNVESILKDSGSFYSQFASNGEDWLPDAKLGIAPAADRIVRFDHNQPEYDEVVGAIEGVEKAFRGANSLGIDDDEKSRLHSSIKSARELLNAAQLKYIQIQVGIKMVIEDLKPFVLSKTLEMALNVLMVAFKKFCKVRLGLDWDTL